MIDTQRMPYDPVQGQGQGHGGPKVAKNGRFQSLSSLPIGMYRGNQTTNTEL